MQLHYRLSWCSRTCGLMHDSCRKPQTTRLDGVPSAIKRLSEPAFFIDGDSGSVIERRLKFSCITRPVAKAWAYVANAKQFESIIKATKLLCIASSDKMMIFCLRISPWVAKERHKIYDEPSDGRIDFMSRRSGEGETLLNYAFLCRAREENKIIY